MSENWNESFQNEPIDLTPRPGFEAELRNGLVGQWNGTSIILPTAARTRAERPTRRGWLLGAVAVALLLVGGLVVATRPSNDSTVQTPISEPEPTTTVNPNVPSTDVPIKHNPDPTLGPPATTLTETTIAPSTSTTPGTTTPDTPAGIPVPVNATAPLPLELITTVAYGPGDDQVEVLNGEFPPPAVWHIGGILVLEDAVDSGLTGHGLIVQTGPDSAFEGGTQQRVSAVTIDVAEPGGTPIAVRSLDGGGVVVVTAHEEDPRVRIRQYTQNPPGVFSELGDRADRAALGDSQLRITSDGATWGGEVVIPSSGSNPGAARPIVTSDPPFGVFAALMINRPAQDGLSAMTWTLDIEIDEESPPGSGGLQVEPFGDGALLTFSNSGARTSESALVVLDDEGGGVAYDLDGWAVADVRPEGALMVRSTTDGLELAVLRPGAVAT